MTFERPDRGPVHTNIRTRDAAVESFTRSGRSRVRMHVHMRQGDRATPLTRDRPDSGITGSHRLTRSHPRACRNPPLAGCTWALPLLTQRPDPPRSGTMSAGTIHGRSSPYGVTRTAAQNPPTG